MKSLVCAVTVAVICGMQLSIAGAAATPTQTCIANKLMAWGKRRSCEATQNAKAVLGKSADLPKCETKFADKLAALNAKAAAKGLACRYIDNGDGTVTDSDTGLQWEKKVYNSCSTATVICFGDEDCTNFGGGTCQPCLHCVNDIYSWSADGDPQPRAPDGSVFTSYDFVPFLTPPFRSVHVVGFLDRLNTCAIRFDSTVIEGFASHCDWRVPTIQELETVVDPGAVGCGSGSSCIDPILGPTNSAYLYYWSSTSDDSNSEAWVLAFHTTGPFAETLFDKSRSLPVRAVRSGF